MAVESRRKLRRTTTILSIQRGRTPEFSQTKRTAALTAFCAILLAPTLLHSASAAQEGAVDRPEDLKIYTRSAGAVILSPFLPMLFERLELTRDSQFIDEISASKAVRALEYAVYGTTGREPPELALEKLLCGLPASTALAPRDVTFQPQDLEIIDAMLSAVLANWEPLRNSSVEGLRETFLQRDGAIQTADDRDALTVQRKTLDVLVDQLPWSISPIHHPWMARPLQVFWR